MDVVVPCECGAKFSFTVEPVQGKLPEGAELLCPSCQRDGVALANRVIAAELALAQANAKPASSAPAPASSTKKSWPFSKKEQAAPAEVKFHEGPIEEEVPAADQTYTGPNKTKGRIGALLGAVIGMLVWFGILYFTGREIRWIALGVGALVGFGSRWIGGGRDYHLGIFAATCSFCAIFAGQILATHVATQQASWSVARLDYTLELARAEAVAKAKTDIELKAALAKLRSTELETVRPDEITDEELNEFKTGELPALQKLAAGDPSQEAYVAQKREEFLGKVTFRDLFNDSLSPYIFLWLFLGAGAAWKIASDYGTSVDFD